MLHQQCSLTRFEGHLIMVKGKKHFSTVPKGITGMSSCTSQELRSIQRHLHISIMAWLSYTFSAGHGNGWVNFFGLAWTIGAGLNRAGYP